MRTVTRTSLLSPTHPTVPLGSHMRGRRELLLCGHRMRSHVTCLVQVCRPEERAERMEFDAVRAQSSEHARNESEGSVRGGEACSGACRHGCGQT